MVKSKVFFLSIILHVFILTPASADIYKWVDSDGEVHFSDSTPMESEIQGGVEQIETQYENYPYSEEYAEEGNNDFKDDDYSEFGGKAPYESYAGRHIHTIFSNPADSKHMRYLSRAIENLQEKIIRDNFREISKEDLLSHDFLHDGLSQSVLAADKVVAYEGGPGNIRPVYVVLLQKRMPDGNGREMIRSKAEGHYNYAGQEKIVREKAGAASDYFHKLTLWSIKDRQKICKKMGGNCYKKQNR